MGRFRWACPIIGILTALCSTTLAQSVPIGTVDQLNDAIGSRVEASVVLSTADAINTGAYKWSLDQASGNITRLTWEFDWGKNKPIFGSDITYVWDSCGGVGYADFTDHFNTGALAGNTSDFQTFAFGENIGPRIFLIPDISVFPSIGGILGNTENKFSANNAAGESLVSGPGADYVNWNVQTFTIQPGAQLQYLHQFGPLRVRARTDYQDYTTFPMFRSTDVLSFRGSGGAWQNGIDLDYNTGAKVFTCDLHLGGGFSREDLFRGLQDALDVDHYWNLSGRVMFDTKGKAWIFSALGPGVTYTWGHGFHGYSVGIVIGIAF